MAFGKKRIIRVEFFEARTERTIGYDEMPLKEIPEDFTDQTWVEIDGDRWKVVMVEPDKPHKAKKTGTLIVHVELVEKRTPVEEEAPVEVVKPAPVFSYPSRADQMPRMSGHREDLHLLEIGTWEWRDREFTVATNRSVVREVFGKIEELILLNSTVRDGQTYYTRQYDRYDLFAPLRGSKILLETIVTDYFPTSRAIDGLTFMGSDQVADSTFVFRVNSGTVFYGQEFDEVVRYLAVHRPAELLPEPLREDCRQLAAFMQKKGLILVDWPQRKIINADDEALLDYFLEGFAMDAIASAKDVWARNPVTPVVSAGQNGEIDLEKKGNEPPTLEFVTSAEPIIEDGISTEEPKSEELTSSESTPESETTTMDFEFNTPTADPVEADAGTESPDSDPKAN